jgi:hypothetical protein
VTDEIVSIESLATRVVQQAPERDAQTFLSLRLALERVTGPAVGPLARSIWRIYELVEMDAVDPAIALPALAEACATLAAGLRGDVDDRVLEASRYQIDTLQPIPDPPKRFYIAPDVPLTQLRKK